MLRHRLSAQLWPRLGRRFYFESSQVRRLSPGHAVASAANPRPSAGRAYYRTMLQGEAGAVAARHILSFTDVQVIAPAALKAAVHEFAVRIGSWACAPDRR